MKSGLTKKLVLVASLATLFIFLFTMETAKGKKSNTDSHPAKQEAHAWAIKGKTDPWTLLKNQFVWNTIGKEKKSDRTEVGC